MSRLNAHCLPVLNGSIDQTLVKSLHGLLNCEIGGLDCRVITTEYRSRVHCIHMFHLFCNALIGQCDLFKSVWSIFSCNTTWDLILLVNEYQNALTKYQNALTKYQNALTKYQNALTKISKCFNQISKRFNQISKRFNQNIKTL